MIASVADAKQRSQDFMSSALCDAKMKEPDTYHGAGLPPWGLETQASHPSYL